MPDADAHAADLATLNDLLDHALELPEHQRQRWIDDLPPEHDALRSRLRRMLCPGGERATFLETIPKIDARDRQSGDSAEDPPPSPDSIAPYRVLRRLAVGGMGTVWLAHRTDVMVNRLVALKLPKGSWRGDALARRLAEEREILAALNHPNIARLYDAGITPSGQPYLALEYVEGWPIDHYARTRQLSLHARLQVFLLVARAVAHAHARLIVHRDLKPNNILVTSDGDVKLLDFGIGKLLDDGRRAAVTEDSVQMLTPEYASPEQIARQPLGIGTDVYSIGVILYELLTGVRPFTRTRTFRGRPSEAAVAVASRRPLRGDLDAIVLKALETEPDNRYHTVNALADDIDRYLRKRPVHARPDNEWYRVSKFVARNRVAVGGALAILTTILVGTGLAAWQSHVAVTEKARAVEVKDFLIALFEDASPYNTGGRPLSAADWLKQARSRIDRRLGERPALRVELLTIVGASLLNLQDTSGAEDILTEAIREGGARLGPDHPATLHARVLMTHVYRFRGTEEGRAEIQRLLPVLRASRLDKDLSIALKNQAHLEIDAGRYGVADRAAQEAVEVSLRAGGHRDPDYIAALLTRAYAYQYSRGAEESLREAEHAYRTALTVFGNAPTHPRVIEGRLLYGRALGEAGHLRKAVDELSRTVSAAAAVFGPSSRMVGFFSLPLAEYQMEIGRTSEAVDISRAALDIVAQHTKPQSFRYAAALHRRGAALLAARRPAEAVPDLRASIETLRRTLPAQHSVTRWFQADWALALARAGQRREAEELVAPLLPAPGSPIDPSGSKALYVLGVIKRRNGDLSGALTLLRQSLDSTPPARRANLRRMRTLTEIGLTLLDLGRPAAATESLERALALSREQQVPSAPDRADIDAGLHRLRFR